MIRLLLGLIYDGVEVNLQRIATANSLLGYSLTVTLLGQLRIL